MLVLGIETSCDETASALVNDGTQILSSIVSSQVELHRKFRGVVPEIACRAHMETILPCLEELFARAGLSLDNIEAVAATYMPGLVGALLVGVEVAKTLAFLLQKPFVGVNHLHAHIYANVLADPELEFPLVALVASGGHTSLFYCKDVTSLELLGATTDDACGEAFDKVAAILNLGYPGGPAIEEVARGGDPSAIRFPRTMLAPESLDFSFSGIKTAVLYHVGGKNIKAGKVPIAIKSSEIADIAASFQEAVVDVLVAKAILAAKKKNVKRLALGGGVACNGRLREKMAIACKKEHKALTFPPVGLCTDNAAIVAGLAHHLLSRGIRSGLDLDVKARWE